MLWYSKPFVSIMPHFVARALRRLSILVQLLCYLQMDAYSFPPVGGMVIQ